jgi:VCBS repeat protein
MKRVNSHLTLLVSAIMLSGLFHTAPVLAAGCPTPTFEVAHTLETAHGITFIEAADFNGDGKSDLVLVNEQDESVSIFIGGGDGAFQPALSHRAGPGSISLSTADFNRDGKFDLCVANYGSTNVSLFMGNGDGTFQTPVNYDVGSNPLSTATADFNRDGKLDLAVANHFSGNVSVLLGNGDGTFRSAVNYGAGQRAASVATGDFDSDGRTDLAVAHDFIYVSILSGAGDGTFQFAGRHNVGWNPRFVIVDDFNEDGRQDLAVANAGVPPDYTNSTVSVLLGVGDGTFDNAVNHEAGPHARRVSSGDFNADGKRDLVTANFFRSSRDISIVAGNGDGTFRPAVHQYATGGGSLSVATGDFNRDGRPDLAVASELPDEISDSVSVLLNTCASAAVDVSIVGGNNNVTISWPFPSTGFVLESTTNLSPPNWQPAVEVPATNNGRFEVSVSLNQVERYFRLRKP